MCTIRPCAHTHVTWAESKITKTIRILRVPNFLFDGDKFSTSLKHFNYCYPNNKKLYHIIKWGPNKQDWSTLSAHRHLFFKKCVHSIILPPTLTKCVNLVSFFHFLMESPVSIQTSSLSNQAALFTETKYLHYNSGKHCEKSSQPEQTQP